MFRSPIHGMEGRDRAELIGHGILRKKNNKKTILVTERNKPSAKKTNTDSKRNQNCRLIFNHVDLNPDITCKRLCVYFGCWQPAY